MTTIHDYTFENEEVILDHVHFVECIFRECELVYMGTGETRADDSELIDCTIELRGPASNTVGYLQTAYSEGVKGPVIRIIQDILGLERSIMLVEDEDSPSGYEYLMSLGPVPEAEINQLVEEEHVEGEEQAAEEE